MSRLSSDYLFHYKKSIGVLCLILKDGFRHNTWAETLPYGNAKQQNFICSFCDILPNQAAQHAACYGMNALGLSKKWGIENGIAPVRYVHRTSIGVSGEYPTLKQMWRLAASLTRYNSHEMVSPYLCISRLYSQGLIGNGNVEAALTSDILGTLRLGEAAEELNRTFKNLPEGEAKTALFKYLSDLFNRIGELHNELERRDAFVRAYVEDFKPSDGPLIKDKVLYDEREWRSIRMISEKSVESHFERNCEASKNGFLPLEYNLRFTADDLMAVVVEHEEDKLIVRDYTSSHKCLVSADDLTAKLVTFEELASRTSC